MGHFTNVPRECSVMPIIRQLGLMLEIVIVYKTRIWNTVLVSSYFIITSNLHAPKAYVRCYFIL